MLNNYVNLLEFESTSYDGSDWTTAFQKGIEKLETQGGGTLFIPAGVYSTRSIHLKSNITLYLDSGAHLSFKDDYENYDLVVSEFEGYSIKMYKPLIFADYAENIAIVGNGSINGNGTRAWREMNTLEHKRPYLVCLQNSKGVKIEGVTLLNSPVWTVHLLYCDNVIVHGVTIINPLDSPNTDGINPNSCRNVRISDCFIDVGDDCIVIKAGTEDTPNPRSCENITVTNCNMIHGHGGIVIGSEMSGSIRNVTVSNCVFQDTDRGIRLKTRRRRGGAMERLSFQNIVMDQVLCPFVFNMYYHCGSTLEDRHVWEKIAYPVDAGTPVIRDILISNVIANNVTSAAGFMYGLAEMYVDNITFSNCSIRMALDGEPGMPAMLDGIEPMAGAGFYMRNAKNIVFNSVQIYDVKGEKIDRDDTVGLVIRE